MSWTDYTHAKHFGGGIYRPYSDLLADVELAFDNLLSADPPFAKSVRPLPERDIVFVWGAKIAVIAISRSCFRHHPFRATFKWEEFFTSTEDQFIPRSGALTDDARVLTMSDVTAHVVKVFNLADPLILALPALFIVKDDSNEAAITRNRSISSAAQFLWQWERTFYETKVETDRIPQKELEQKFKILLSAAQEKKDFEEWHSTCTTIGVLFLDIDSFKNLNEKYTETKIDATVLPDVQRSLKKLTDSRGGAYRHGGEEFVILLPNHDIDETRAFAEKIRSAIAAHPFQIDEESITVTTSIGASVWPTHGSSFDEVLIAANHAEHAAKKQGRNRVEIATKVTGLQGS
jgi:diguanylate cyclase (GGDEF)-like protein